MKGRQRLVGGPFATVVDHFYREDSLWLVLHLPNGTRVVAPHHWTDLPTETRPQPRHPSVLHPPTLIALATTCQRLRQATPKRRAT